MHASFLPDLPVVDDGCKGSCLVACTGPRVGASDFIITIELFLITQYRGKFRSGEFS